MRKSLLAAILILVSGCTVYKNGDRDDFDQNGKSRAPVSQKPALSIDDEDLLANPCAAFNDVSDDQLRSVFGSNPRLSLVNQISPKTSTCLVTNSSDAREDMSAISVLSCSWKPVDGRPVPVAPDEISFQTTEDDLRASGFDVVSATVVSGDTLRMNCEAYVPTMSLIEDRRDRNERATDFVSRRFAAFARDLNRETLTSGAQH